MKNVSFYLIHNNSKDRIEIKNQLKDLASKFNIELIEIYKQRKNLQINFNLKIKLIIFKIYLLRLSYNLKHKKEFSLKFYNLVFKSFLNAIKYIINLIFNNKSQDIKTYKHLMIESIVTRKHIKAWKHFLKSKKEIMVIFEDDAVCEKDTEKRLKDYFESFKFLDLNNIFIDLAGGFNTKDVIPFRKIKKTKGEFLFVEGIYTNTACSYLIGRDLLKQLYQEYKRSKLNNSFPIDHLINKLGLKIKGNENILSIHLMKPIFTHGSFEGNIKSWQIY